MAPLAYFLGEMTALVHKFDGHRQFHAISKFQLAVKHQFVQLLPDFIAVRSAADDALFDAPCFPEVAEAHDLVLHAVILRVNASSQHQNTLWQFCGIFLPAAQHGILVLHIATVFPQQPKAGVVDDLHLLGVAQRIQVFQHGVFPCRPLRNKAVQPEAADAVLIGCRIFGLPVSGCPLHGHLVRNAAALRAEIPHVLDLVGFLAVGLNGVVIVPNIFPAQFVEALAVRALGYPAFHRSLDVGLCDGTVSLDGGGTDLHRLRIIERSLSGHCQFPRVALSAGTRSPAVAFIAQHIADGFRC